MNLYLFIKYWGKHKRRLFSLILSIILLTGTAVFSILNERTELRRNLHGSYDTFGNYAFAVLNVTDDQDKQIRELPYIDRIGIVSAVGRIKVGDRSYTIGCFENEEAENSLHLNITDGHLPAHSGQVVMPEFLVNQLYPTVEIGDEIMLEFENPDGNIISAVYELSGIIGGDSNRNDMEYVSRNGGITITGSLYETSYYTPSIYIHKDDTEGFEKYFNYFISPTEESYFSEEETSNFGTTWDKIYEITDAQNIISGNKWLVFDLQSGVNDNYSNIIVTKTSDNINVIRIITILMVIVAAISMFSGVMAIMPQRIESLRLLKSIGMSKKMLLSLFVTEFFVFWAMGNILGVASGCGVHELVILLQKKLGIAAYRGYFTEYIISRRTISPFVMPVVLSLITAALSLIVPIKNIVTMTYYKKHPANMSRRKANTLGTAFSKMTGTRFLSALSCVSMVIVIVTTVFGYCYYTESGKGTTLLSVGNENVSDRYFKVGEINIRDNDIDCVISANLPATDGFSVHNREYGISDSELNSLEKSAYLFAWGRYPAFTVLYDEDMEVPKQISSCIREWSPVWEYYDEFRDSSLYDLNLEFINNNMMEMIGADPDDIILLSENNTFPYEVGDTVPMVTCLMDDNDTHVQLDAMKHIDVKITKQIPVKSLKIEGNDILNNCGVFKFSSYAIIMTAETADKIGFYYPGYSSVMMRFDEKISDNEIKSYVSSSVTKPVRTITIYDLERNARINMLSSNANAVILFVLMFILCSISVWNLLRMNVQNSIEKFMILHSLGLSFAKIKKMFIGNVMKISAIAAAVGVILSFAGKGFLTAKYNEYFSLLVRQQEMSGNSDFPDVIIGYSLDFLEESEPLYEITSEMKRLKEIFLLEKEMWLPGIFIPLGTVCAVIIISTLICSLSAAKNIKNERIQNNDQS